MPYLSYIIPDRKRGQMQPLRKDHVDYYKTLTNSKFDKKQDVIESEIDKDAQVIVDKKHKAFPKELGLESLMKDLEKKVKKLKDFQEKKASIEQDLELDARLVADNLAERFKRLSKIRRWEDSKIDTIDVKKEDPISYVMKKIKDACYEEAERHVRGNHKLYHALENKRERCLTILHTGSHIQPTLSELSKEMSTARIQLDIPTALLALPSN